MGDIYIHIYGTPPSDSPQSILIYCLYMYIYIYTYILYLCAYMYKSQIFFQMSCGQQLCTLSKQVGNKKQYLTTILERIQRENPKNQKTLRKPTGNNIWRLFGETLLTKSKKLRENQKKQKNKTFQRMFGLRLMFGFFWFSLFFFVFFFGFDLEKTEKTQVFFCFFG